MAATKPASVIFHQGLQMTRMLGVHILGNLLADGQMQPHSEAVTCLRGCAWDRLLVKSWPDWPSAGIGLSLYHKAGKHLADFSK